MVDMMRMLLLFALLWPSGSFADVPAKAGWPDLETAPPAGGGEGDAAVVAAIERYAYVAPVPGAVANGAAWFTHLTEGRKIDVERVRLLRNRRVTVEGLRRRLREAAESVKPGGTLWFVFIGHGVPAKDGKDGLLVGADAQQEPESLYARSLARSEVMEILRKSRAARIVAVLDACFSGKTSAGRPLVEGLQPLVVTGMVAPPADTRALVLTAARSDEFAGPLPGLRRPAFSYLVLGAMRGWADANGDGKVTMGETVEYVGKVLRVLAEGRNQTPTLEGDREAVLGMGREVGPPLRALVLRYGEGAEEPSASPEVRAPPKPTEAPPKKAEVHTPPKAVERPPPSGLDLLHRFLGDFISEGVALPGALAPGSVQTPAQGATTCRRQGEAFRCHALVRFGAGLSAVQYSETTTIVWDASAGLYRMAIESNLGNVQGTGRVENGGARMILEWPVPPNLRLRSTYDFGTQQMRGSYTLERSLDGGPFQPTMRAVFVRRR
jgi:hypothetical protein